MMRLIPSIEPLFSTVRSWLLNLEGPLDILREAARKVPPAEWAHWVRYDWACESKKRTCNDLHLLPYPLNHILRRLNSPEWIAELREELKLDFPLERDNWLWGAGIHVMDPGGVLGPHLDYSLHKSGLERRLNLVLFLNEEWRKEWGGAFEMYDDEARSCGLIYPQFGQAVVWESSEIAYHGTQRTTPDAPPRLTAAAYYLSPPRPGCVRKRALFVPRREQP